MEKDAGTDIIEFIFHKYKPKYRRETYVLAVCDIRLQKTETHRTRLTAGGNLIYYTGEVNTATSDLTTMKLHGNSTISDKDFYLNNHMNGVEYITIQISMIPREFEDKYNFNKKSHNGYIFVRVTKGIRGIQQVGLI